MHDNGLGSGRKYDLEMLTSIADQASILETFANPHPDLDYLIESRTEEFTAVCPITGQPDFATITIETRPAALCVELKSLKQYLLSFRNRGIFHEAVTGQIAKDLAARLAPRWLRVTGSFSVRGGIGTRVVVELPAGKP